MSLSSTKQLIRKLFYEGISSVKPDILINGVLKVERDRVIVDSYHYDLSKGKCFVIGFGKAVADMALHAETIIGDKFYKGILSVPQGYKIKNYDSKYKIFHGGVNNMPDRNSINATEEIIKLTSEATENDLVLVLISGGGSALLCKPKAVLSLDEKLNLIKTLANSGADIKELNCVRKRISEVKGGKLAKFIFPANSVSLIISDIVGDPVSLIASGPTVKNSEEIKEAIQILKKYGIKNNKYYDIINNDEVIDNKIFNKVHNIILANNKLLLKSIKNTAINNDYKSIILSNAIEDNIEKLSHIYAKLVKLIFEYKQHANFLFLETILTELNIKYSKISKLKNILDSDCNRICLLFGGETVVNIKGKGKGGRNQELVLRFSKIIDSFYKGSIDESKVILLSGGTDGIDGPTDAAGAIAYPGQSITAINQGLNPDDFIISNDSYNYFSKLNNSDDLIKIGHTGVNVMDVHIILINF